MNRWWALSVLVAIGAVLFGFDGISAGPRVVTRILLVGSVALVAVAIAGRAAQLGARSD